MERDRGRRLSTLDPGMRGPANDTELAADLAFLDARAERWLGDAQVRAMIDVSPDVLARWASPEILARFRATIERMVRNAYVEGAADAWADVTARRLAAEKGTD